MPDRHVETSQGRRSRAEQQARLNRVYGLKVSSWHFREAIVTGSIPAYRASDGRSWEFDPADEAEIVAYFRSAAEPVALPRSKPRPRPAGPSLPPAA